MKILLLFTFFLTISLSIYLFIKLKKEDIFSKFILASIPISLYIVLNTFILKLFSLTSDTWSQNRLSASFALVNGYKIINNMDSGVVQTWTYGPIAQVAFIPITFFQEPHFILFTAGILNIIYFFIPVLCFCLAQPLYLKNLKLISLGLIVFCLTSGLIIFYSEPLESSAFNIGPDSPSLCFAGLSVAILYYKYLSKNQSNYYFFISSFLAIISIWNKQNLILLPIILIIYVFLIEGIRKSLIYLLNFIISTIIISVPLILIFTWKYLYFAMFKFPSSYPSWNLENTSILQTLLSNEGFFLLLNTGLDLIKHCLPFLVILLFFTIYQIKQKITRFNVKQIIDFLKTSTFLLPLFVSIGMIPVTLSSKIKLGGVVNSFSLSVYFVMLSVIAIILEIVSEKYHNIGSQDNKTIKLGKIIVLFLIGLHFFYFNPLKYYQINTAAMYNLNKKSSELKIATNILKNNDNIYFPDFPLAHLLAQKKLYHSLKGMADRKEGRTELEIEHFNNFIPPFDYIAFGLNDSIKRSLFQQERVKYFIDLLNKSDIKLQKESNYNELSDWLIYSKEK